MSTLEGRFREQDPVVGNNTDLMSVYPGEPGHECRSVVSLELGEFASIDNSRDDFMYGYLLAKVSPHYAAKLLRIVQRFLEASLQRFLPRPIEIGDGPSGKDNGMGIVDSQIIRHARNRTVKDPATQLFRRN